MNLTFPEKLPKLGISMMQKLNIFFGEKNTSLHQYPHPRITGIRCN